MRKPAKPYALEKVWATTIFGYSRNKSMATFVSAAVLNWMYASSNSTSTSLGTAAMSLRASASDSDVDVGLFGLLTMTRRVCSLMAAIIASMSWLPSGRFGTFTLVAPAFATMIGYASKLRHG